jgi:hypothetical protein
MTPTRVSDLLMMSGTGKPRAGAVVYGGITRMDVQWLDEQAVTL